MLDPLSQFDGKMKTKDWSKPPGVNRKANRVEYSTTQQRAAVCARRASMRSKPTFLRAQASTNWRSTRFQSATV